MKKFFAILTVAAFTMGLSFAQTTPSKPADKPASTESKDKKKKKKKTTTDSAVPASTDKSAPKKQ
jgi:hypothetical protein